MAKHHCQTSSDDEEEVLATLQHPNRRAANKRKISNQLILKKAVNTVKNNKIKLQGSSATSPNTFNKTPDDLIENLNPSQNIIPTRTLHVLLKNTDKTITSSFKTSGDEEVKFKSPGRGRSRKSTTHDGCEGKPEAKLSKQCSRAPNVSRKDVVGKGKDIENVIEHIKDNITKKHQGLTQVCCIF